MGSVTFRSKQTIEESVEKPKVIPVETQTEVDDHIEVPYTEYEHVNRKPFIADYYQLGERWEEGFGEEVLAIEGYLKHKINNGEIANSINAIKYELKKLEKVNNLNHEERSVVKTGVISAYVKFLMETDNIKYNMRKYG